MKGFRFIEYHVDNGVLIEEKIQVRASHVSVITITRDATVRDLHNKYTVEPASFIAVDQSMRGHKSPEL